MWDMSYPIEGFDRKRDGGRSVKWCAACTGNLPHQDDCQIIAKLQRLLVGTCAVHSERACREHWYYDELKAET